MTGGPFLFEGCWCPMKIKRQTTYFLRITVEDSDRKHVKLWASPQATMEVPLETDAIMWQQLRGSLQAWECLVLPYWMKLKNNYLAVDMPDYPIRI